jgi:NAD(P)-dependent dehydrogenase (short-subunit alcohol dehydrogenase family)
MGSLSGKVTVVTGSTSGIGAETVRLFAAEGARVAIAACRSDQGEALAAALGPDALFVRTDVRNEADVQALIAAAVDRYGRLDVLVNNAGSGGTPGGIASLDLERLDEAMAVHVHGVVAGMKHAAPVMIEQGAGSMINVASIGGHIAGWTFLDYSAAKAAVLQLTRCVAAELGSHNVRVNSISPGPILTGIFAKGAGINPTDADRSAADLEPAFHERLDLYQPIRRAGMPVDVARAALWLASDAASFVTGQDVVVDGGILAGRPPAASAADFAAIGKALVSAATS